MTPDSLRLQRELDQQRLTPMGMSRRAVPLPVIKRVDLPPGVDLDRLLDAVEQLTKPCVELIADVADHEKRRVAEAQVAAVEAQRAEAIA